MSHSTMTTTTEDDGTMPTCFDMDHLTDHIRATFPAASDAEVLAALPGLCIAAAIAFAAERLCEVQTAANTRNHHN